MTTEVILMNRHGVALAADRALTVEGAKVYATAKKIFPLGSHHEVAVMAYGKGHLMNVPWPVLISTFKSHLPKEPLPSIKHYGELFIDYMTHNDYDELMNPEFEDNFIKESLYTTIDALIKSCKKKHREIFKKHYKKIPMEESQQIYNEKMEKMLAKILQALEEKPLYQPFSHKDLNRLVDKYSQQISQYLQEEMLRCFRTKKICEQLLLIAFHSLLKENKIFRTNLVFVGYGQNSLFPEMMTIELGTKINGRLKYRLKEDQTYRMDLLNPGKIFTFGQDQMIEAFLTGIHEELEDDIYDRLNEQLANMPEIIDELMIDYIPDQQSRVKVVKQIEEKLIHVYYAVQKGLLKKKSNRFIYPIESLVKAMPPETLANIAKELVMIEVLQGKLSKTVARTKAPIHVATITKGEGFQWVKNK